MKPYRILGSAWTALCIIGVIALAKVTPQLEFRYSSFWLKSCLHILLWLYLAGAVASFLLYRGATGARKFVSFVAILTLVACSLFVASNPLSQSVPFALAGAFSLGSLIIMLSSKEKWERTRVATLLEKEDVEATQRWFQYATPELRACARPLADKRISITYAAYGGQIHGPLEAGLVLKAALTDLGAIVVPEGDAYDAHVAIRHGQSGSGKFTVTTKSEKSEKECDPNLLIPSVIQNLADTLGKEDAVIAAQRLFPGPPPK